MKAPLHTCRVLAPSPADPPPPGMEKSPNPKQGEVCVWKACMYHDTKDRLG